MRELILRASGMAGYSAGAILIAASMAYAPETNDLSERKRDYERRIVDIDEKLSEDTNASLEKMHDPKYQQEKRKDYEGLKDKKKKEETGLASLISTPEYKEHEKEKNRNQAFWLLGLTSFVGAAYLRRRAFETPAPN
jgi:hypothetical protein